MSVLRCERHVINKNHPMYKTVDEYCFKSKNLYNFANYNVRQKYIFNKEYIPYPASSRLLKNSKEFKDIGSNSAQMTLRILHQNWTSFFEASKSYNKNSSKFLGKPNLPKYLKKEGRFVFVLTNVQSKIQDEKLVFSFKPFKQFNGMISTKVKEKHMQTRFVPKGDMYILEIVYERVVNNKTSIENDRILGIDLGIGRIATIQNNIGVKPIAINGGKIKSVNNFYNKEISHYSAKASKVNKLRWTKRLQRITDKRSRILETELHKITRYIVNYALAYKIDTVIIGYNNGWKQSVKLGKANQSFVYIPFQNFVSKLEYKLEDVGIKLIKTEESYTSKASFIDSDALARGKYTGKRVYRGLYMSKDGTLINADINGAGNIIKKVFPNAFDGIKGVHFHPTIINL